MRYVTSVERIGIKKGLQQGLQQGEIRVLRRQLTRRFGELPVWVEDRLQEAPLEQLELWGERLLEASRLEEVFEASGGLMGACKKTPLCDLVERG